MQIFLRMTPAMLLLIGAAIGVWRGLGREGDSSANKARGGGAEAHNREP